jgi:hypothetical protein
MIVGTPISSVIICVTQAFTADVFTSTTDVCPHRWRTWLRHAPLRVAVVLGERWPCVVDHDAYISPTVIRPARGAT